MHHRRSGAARACCLAAVMAGVVGIGSAAPSAAQSSRINLNTTVPGKMGIPQPEPLITLSSKQPRSLARVLYEVFKQTTFDYQLLADVGTTAFTADLNKVPLTQALTQILGQEKRPDPLVYSYQKSISGKNGTFIIDREFMELGTVEGEKKVSLANARITQVLPALFKEMKVPGRVEPDVPPVTISVQLRPDDWSEVLPQILLEAYKKEPAITYSKDGDTWVVHLLRTPTGAPTNPLPAGTQPRRVKLALADVPLTDALAQLFQGSTWKFQVAENVQKNLRVTYNAAAEPELAALQSILKLAPQQGQQVTYREGKGILYIEEGPLPGDFQVASKTGTVRRTSLNLQQRKLKSVVEIIGGALGTKITVAPNVPDVPVSVRLVDAGIDEWMRAIISAAKESLPNIGYRTQGTGYVIELK